MGLLTSHTRPAQAAHTVSHVCARRLCVGAEIPRASCVGAVLPVQIIVVSRFLLKLPADVRVRIEDGLEQSRRNFSLATLRWEDGCVVEGELDEL